MFGLEVKNLSLHHVVNQVNPEVFLCFGGIFLRVPGSSSVIVVVIIMISTLSRPTMSQGLYACT